VVIVELVLIESELCFYPRISGCNLNFNPASSGSGVISLVERWDKDPSIAFSRHSPLYFSTQVEVRSFVHYIIIF
jgi:hypothetical protein